MITDTVSWPEAVWTALAVIGVVYSLLNLNEAMLDLRAVRTISPRNGRHRLARAGVRNETSRLLVQAGFAGVGLLAMTVTNSASTTTRTVIGLIVIGVVLTQALNTFLDRQLRIDLERMRAVVSKDIPVGDHTHEVAVEPTTSGPVDP